MAVRFLLGAHEGDDFQRALSRTLGLPAWAPFDARVVAFVARFSQCLLMHKRSREFPELLALGHWFRAARLRDLAHEQQNESAEWLRRGRGLAFHLAPANVDSVFMYSWLLSLLAGNVNWVRVSQKSSVQLDFLIEVLREVLAEDVGAAVAGRFVLLTYPHDQAITTALSQACMVRVVWGGDETVVAIRAIPLRPTAHEICFPDRFSAAALDAGAVLGASDATIQQLAKDFYNDAFWFAQQACSSPRLVAWVGSAADCTSAQQRFWAAVNAEVLRRESENSPAMSMARLGAAFELAANGLVALPTGVQLAAFPARLFLQAELNAAVKRVHCGNGLFLEQQVGTLAELAKQLSDKEQTLAVFGFNRREIVELVDALPARAIDRIVPIGEALNFEVVWDGVDLLQLFTRQITLPKACSLLKEHGA